MLKDKAIYAEFEPEFYYEVKIAALRSDLSLKQFLRQALQEKMLNDRAATAGS